jgi:hypothetical protein
MNNELKTWQEVGNYLSGFTVNASLLNNLSRIADDVDIRDFVAKGQLASKLWASTMFNQHVKSSRVAVCGGWYGLLPAILLHNNHEKRNIFTSIDIDANCAAIANSFNAEHYFSGEFYADTQDMYQLDYSNYDVIINTSCEHIADLTAWLATIPSGKRVMLQSNNFYECDQHINCVNSMSEFKSQIGPACVITTGTLVMPNYTRFMILCTV